MRVVLLTLWMGQAMALANIARADEQLVRTVAQVKLSIVGVGTYATVKRPPARLLGTGFVVENGLRVATNSHVVDLSLDAASNEHLVVFVGHGESIEYRAARVTARDKEHDVAVLDIEGAALPALQLGQNVPLQEGMSIAFTGFPIGAILGLVPVTHQGILAALTPIATPAAHAAQLTAGKIAALRSPYTVLQLDATAYPGNSGSPVYTPDNGKVIGVINQVFVKGRKEDVLREPSAITYAIPVRYLAALLEQN